MVRIAKSLKKPEQGYPHRDHRSRRKSKFKNKKMIIMNASKRRRREERVIREMERQIRNVKQYAGEI